MTSIELLREVVKRTGSSIAEVEQIIDTAKEVILDAVQKGDYVKLSHFGTFLPKDIKARVVFGGKMSHARRSVKFRPTKEINNGKE